MTPIHESENNEKQISISPVLHKHNGELCSRVACHVVGISFTTNESEKKCCEKCSAYGHSMKAKCYKPDCPCHSVPVEKCSCLEDNKLSQALCKVHSKNNSVPVDMTWEERFDTEFTYTLVALKGNSSKNDKVKSFIASEREILLNELIEEIEKMRKDFFVFDDERKVISCVSHNSALKEIKELIRKKM